MKFTQLCLTLLPHGLYIPFNSPGQNTRVGSYSLVQGIFPTQGSNSGLPHCRQILLLAEPPGKPKNTGVGSLYLLQQIFLNQESNQGLLRCRQILYQLSYEGVLVDNVKFISMRYVSTFIPTNNVTVSVSSQPKEQRL